MLKYDQEIDMSVETSATLILSHITPGSKVLEFGPSTGYMTRYMKERLNCTIYCVEVDVEAAEISGKYCDKMIIADLDDLRWGSELEGEFFDHIVFADVLEHLRDPSKVLKQAVSLMMKNGTILTSIPNIAHNAIIMELLQGNFDYRSLGLLDDTHIRFFTKKSILKLLDESALMPIIWKATIFLPEHTEFEQKYSSFPLEVQNVLKNHEDGHVYQYVTVSKKVEDVLGDKRIDEDLVIKNKPNLGVMQVFWESDGEFNELNSILVPLEYTEEFYKYEISLPEQVKKGRLRIDPITRPAYVEIDSIEIYDQNNAIKVASYSENNRFEGLLAGKDIVQIDSTSAYKIISIDNDPQLYLEGITEITIESSLKLQITMRFFENIAEKLSQEINKTNQELMDKNELLVRSHEQLDQQSEQLILQERQIIENQQDLLQINNELLDQKKMLVIQIEETAGLNQQISDINREILELNKDLLKAKAEIDAFESSLSWRLTAPLRRVKRLIFKG
ncbi:methyltransferase domain-containing protein [Paenibacillus sp. LMG 31461]|uniref:Methyltransferase domain-containing protein n=1 Tax=Paenibacillus plantarum TaxID=2654975 RepID=A0ABX1XDH7_9BACL|nr:methyltransferase domain-containing protein [Paenibacillus plantarum]NOU66231.1 methyltransferase domain-containing protein [Paenibacillus plantarum]